MSRGTLLFEYYRRLTNIEVKKVGPVFPDTTRSLYPGLGQFILRVSRANLLLILELQFLRLNLPQKARVFRQTKDAVTNVVVFTEHVRNKTVLQYFWKFL